MKIKPSNCFPEIPSMDIFPRSCLDLETILAKTCHSARNAMVRYSQNSHVSIVENFFVSKVENRA